MLVNQGDRRVFKALPEMRERCRGKDGAVPRKKKDKETKSYLLGKEADLYQQIAALKEKIVELSYNPKFGAREMRRVIQDKVENILASAILSNQELYKSIKQKLSLVKVKLGENGASKKAAQIIFKMMNDTKKN